MNATHMWTGIMGFSRDDKPWIGAIPDNENTYIAAGFTGHGMPNTWLSGKAVAVMVAKTLEGVDLDSAIDSASEETGLPKSYQISKDRMEAAMLIEDVESKDWAEMERGKRAEMPMSGYA